jgi:RNA polymerase sigma factor (TIGR02999 family)
MLAKRSPKLQNESFGAIIEVLNGAPHMDSTVDALITSADNGDRSAASALFAALYDELHRLAQRQLAKQHGPAGLGATTLLHEAYLAICDRSGTMFPDRARFMAYAARVMRGLIIDDVRGRLAQKRGGGQYHTELATDVMQRVENPQSLERISDALDELATHDQALAELVDLKFFCGFSSAEIGALRGVSERTVKRDWEKARLYLHRAIAEDTPSA